MDRQEMVDDIIEEMLGARTEFPFVYLMGEPDTPEVVDFRTKKIIEPRKINIRCVTVKELADRLKAARKRERGDCAKLREALKHIKDRLPHMLQYMRVHWEDASAGGYFDELMLVIDAALAAPPRNCDVMDWRTAWKIWREKFHPETPVGYSAVVKGTEAFMDWFAAPATEQEGGNK